MQTADSVSWAVVSGAVRVVAGVLVYWGHSAVRPEVGHFIVGTAIFMVVAMWIFPEAGVKKGDLKK